MTALALILPSTLSFISLLLVFYLSLRFWRAGYDLGTLARLQFFACLSAFISNLGTMSLTFGR